MKTIQSPVLVASPVVSIVIPSYNREDSIVETLLSIINQKCKFDFEIVIGDDCSTDKVRDFLLDYQKKHPQIIVLLFHEQNIGLGANWATCVKHCRGKYIANCDNDDYWHNPDKLQLQVDFLEANLQYGVVHTDYRKHNRDTGLITNEIASNSIIGNETLQESIMKGNFRCCNATVMYCKDLLDKYINLDDYINYQFTLQDWNTWMIVSNYTDFYCMHISTATFGIETESITRPKSYEKLEQRFVKEKECYRYICNLFPEKFPFNDEEYNHFAFNSLLNLAYTRKDFAKAKEYGSKCEKKKLKVICSKNWILFWLFLFVKKINKHS